MRCFDLKRLASDSAQRRRRNRPSTDDRIAPTKTAAISLTWLGALSLVIVTHAAAAPAANAPIVNARLIPGHTPAMPAPKSLLPLATDMLATSVENVKPYGGQPIDVTTYHYDTARTGWNPNETDLSPTTVASPKFGLLKTLNVDGNVFAQPLLITDITMLDGNKHDVLIIATGHNSVYAFDANSFATLWHDDIKTFGEPQSSDDVGCGDVLPEYGISSTPVIVRNKSTDSAIIYLVAASEPASKQFHTFLYAINLRDGSKTASPAEISPVGATSTGQAIKFDPQNQWNRASLAYNNGSIYIGIGSHCDNPVFGPKISGWLLRYDTTLSLKSAFHTIDNPGLRGLASIWMTGFAPAIDPQGNIFVITGNGDFSATGARNYGQSILKLNGDNLQVTDSFTPVRDSTPNLRDNDFGSGGAMLIPRVPNQKAPSMAVAMGKDPVLYLLDQGKLGGVKPGDSGVLQALKLDPSHRGLWGGPAFYQGPSGPTLYVQIEKDVLRSFALDTGVAPTLSAAKTGTTDAGYGGSLPIVSSNRSSPNSGVVWLIRRAEPIEFEAYDAATLGPPIYSTSVGHWSNPNFFGGAGNAFLTPMEANGRVYVATYMTVKVFGLLK